MGLRRNLISDAEEKRLWAMEVSATLADRHTSFLSPPIHSHSHSLLRHSFLSFIIPPFPIPSASLILSITAL